jgi:hypothetical protein
MPKLILTPEQSACSACAIANNQKQSPEPHRKSVVAALGSLGKSLKSQPRLEK